MLIYGSGQLAASAIRDLAEEGTQITVLSKAVTSTERGQLERLTQFPGVSAVLLREAVMQDYLLEAGISHADAFLALSADDHENLLLAQIARQMFNVSYVVCHVENPQLQVLYTALGLKVVGYSRGVLQDIRQVIDA